MKRLPQGVEGGGLVCWSEAKNPMRGGRHYRETYRSRGDHKSKLRGYIGGILAPYAPFWWLFRRGKSHSGHGGEAPERPSGEMQSRRGETSCVPTRPAIGESALHRSDALARTHLGKRAQRRSLCTNQAESLFRRVSALMAGLMVSSLSMAMAEAARPARAVPSRSVPSR